MEKTGRRHLHMMKLRGETVSKQRSFLIPRIGCILLLGMFGLLLPIRGMEAVCRAQAQSPDQATGQTDSQTGATAARFSGNISADSIAARVRSGVPQRAVHPEFR